MKLVSIPDTNGDSLSIIDENFPPEDYIELDDKEYIKDIYDFDDLITLIVSFNKIEVTKI